MQVHEVIKIKKQFNPEWQDTGKTFEVEQWKLARIEGVNNKFMLVTFLNNTGQHLYKECFSVGEFLDGRFLIATLQNGAWEVADKGQFIKFKK